MGDARSLGRSFAWLWAAFAVSTFGTWFAFDAFPLIAIRVLHAGPAAVSLLAASGLAAGALLALPLGPWIEFRRKRPLMIGLDLLRCAALLSIPLAYGLDALTYRHLLLVAVLVSAAGIAHRAASGAFLKSLVPQPQLLEASGRLESTTWTATMLAPPLGGAAIGVFGPVITVAADALSYLLSALGLRAIGDGEAQPRRGGASGSRTGELLEGWRSILAHPILRALFFNSVLINGLIMATAPLLAVLMLGQLGFAPWQYALAFATPCIGGLLGARLSPRLAARYGARRVLLLSGALRSLWSIGLAFVGPGIGGIALVIAVELALIASVGVFNPLFAAYRLEQSPPDRVTRVLAAWNISGNLSIAAMTALWGLFAACIGTRAAIAAAGALMLLTPLLLPWRESARQHIEAQPGRETRE